MKLSKTKVYIVLLLISGLLWWGDGREYFDWLRRPAARIFQPLRAKLYQTQIKPEPERAEKLQQQYDLLTVEAMKLREENESLRKLLGANLPASMAFIPAKILKLDEDEIRLDVGSDQGVKTGQTVIGDGALVGQVVEVTATEAVVRLLLSQDSRVLAVTAGGAEGVVAGYLAEAGLRLTEVLNKHELNQGELVVSKGGDGVRPDLGIGRVAEVFKEDRQVYQEAKLAPIVDVLSLNQVFVIR
ncbi:MAG: Cell shape-determining protein MreC [Candidatus Beckwithbacteria bacterium GW2011_GWB1_47_15]|uniref:Cell shape-determining protein MreC n=1 Tax=Candidatus Beckwithbacteria bacterium GW2011_GWB1_47_15 TaxID=1618371 RepID=A0A0G1UUU0_9BACT|nr:MAG: rod shape-determining protein MreC [Candidatus Beckwithbacteria bacterium GW2011_GWC1_49_16]KKU35242.1 MAG: Cell shape-determining protein MreC [Candidatus Beckwithbacteria bacterium GW2011_GWA1_46_30]KKU61480.1 MAG: Cell shape-determining protein MreC [Candidatus Beckwithbacteria bacterium GW2011_GWB1_47_15]KKU71684.1 MAG: Cell shape-determining protein MreC [Candidatus Beckwithbacteria bacterium GW2011_GWA2_47_25]KKW03782.1 MAG: Cell shape-determining protein MreC [Candidatus Beckwith